MNRLRYSSAEVLLILQTIKATAEPANRAEHKVEIYRNEISRYHDAILRELGETN